ncbi:MAG: hypothetical protein FWC60_04805 [Firmicutes bacterium]|nr:hypothetical protein [Bacillota bacterium]
MRRRPNSKSIPPGLVRQTVNRKRFLGEHERTVNGLACRSMLNNNGTVNSLPNSFKSNFEPRTSNLETKRFGVPLDAEQ